ncbi:MAG TPA: glycosyltransferase family 39 protein [Anaerolineales bacterium]|nr:glycosyltransferase family 39 protein [Anaerolineales bacterium]
MARTDEIAARLGRSEAFWFGVCLAATAFLALYRLDHFPRFNFDEGYYLLLAKNLSEYGKYALSVGPTAVDWFGLGNSSPTLVLPIAVSFGVFGQSVLAGRVVTSLYLIGTALAIYLVMRHLYDWRTGALSLVLFLVSGSLIEYNTLLLGRRVLGEIPALFFVFIALRVWYRSWETRRLWEAALAGLLFGFAFLTKEQFMPLALSAGGLVYLADRLRYRQLSTRLFAIPLLASGVPLLAWYGYKMSILGVAHFSDHLSTLGAVSQASTWLIEPGTWPGSIAFLYSHSFVILGLPGILYAFVLSARPTLAGLKSLFLPVFALLLVLWFVFISIGWWRYGHPGLAVAGVLSAKLVRDLLAGLSLDPARLWAGLTQGTMVRQFIAGVVVLLMVAYPLQDVARQILFDTDRTPQEFADLVADRTEPEALIESYVWEIIFLAPRRFHYPSADVFVQVIERRLDRSYDPLHLGPRYVVDGPYSKSVDLYSETWLGACCRWIGSVGAYDLYAVQESNAP